MLLYIQMKELLKKLWIKIKPQVVVFFSALIPAVLDFLRLAVLSLIPLGLDALPNLNLSPAEIIVSTLFLKMVDKYLHKYGKETDNEFFVKGITRF